jgi:hypothetical protein
MEIPLSEVLDVERQEYMSQVGDLAREREAAIQRIRQGPRSSAIPFLEQQERLRCLRRIVEARVRLREEYGRNDPRLLARDQIDKLLSEITKTLDGFAKHSGPSASAPSLNQRMSAELGEIKARARTSLHKLALKSRWDQMTPIRR